MKTKVCTGDCGRELPATTEYFYKNSVQRNGLSPRCKVCLNRQNKKYRQENKEKIKKQKQKYTQENKDEIASYKREWNQENKDRLSKLKRQWKDDNKGKLQDYYKQYELDNKEHLQTYRKEYYENNKEQYFNRANKRRAQKLNQTPDYANHQLINLIYKHCPKGYDIDHMTPLVKGGLHHESNLCYLPANVNRSKGSKTIEEFGIEEFNEYVIYWQDVLPLG